MTDNQHLQQELNKMAIAYQEALQTNRLKTGFLGRIAHEIRSPLSSIMGLHQLVINNLCDNPEEEKESIKQAYGYAKKLMGMIDQLIEISKLQVGKINPEKEECNLSELLEDIYNLIVLEANNKNIPIKFANQAPNLVSRTDKVRLTNILFYLLEAVIDASEEGIITLTLSENKDNQKALISITFSSESFKLEASEDIFSGDISADNLEKLHGAPQFSRPMKIMLAEALLETLLGSLRLKPNNNRANKLMELDLFLPVEIQTPNY